MLMNHLLYTGDWCEELHWPDPAVEAPLLKVVVRCNGNYLIKPRWSSVTWLTLVGATMDNEVSAKRLEGEYLKQALSTNYVMKTSISYNAAPRFCSFALEFYRVDERSATNKGGHQKLYHTSYLYDKIMDDLWTFIKKNIKIIGNI